MPTVKVTRRKGRTGAKAALRRRAAPALQRGAHQEPQGWWELMEEIWAGIAWKG